MTDIEPKNGFHICPITNAMESGKGTGRVENQPSEDLVV